MNETIYGDLVDDAGRCVHWHSERDVIANRCATCGRLYACFTCHNTNENHEFGRFDEHHQGPIVMCGICGHQFSYERYDSIDQCDNCGAPFNPGCSLHKFYYVK